mmetsp:Transcript_60775/g.163068  ORF Transcript_60775/g.163068 Transcript_60775/m.163068 type:complete len:234 (-) Transcript_60775:308-1009(-)
MKTLLPAPWCRLTLVGAQPARGWCWALRGGRGGRTRAGRARPPCEAAAARGRTGRPRSAGMKRRNSRTGARSWQAVRQTPVLCRESACGPPRTRSATDRCLRKGRVLARARQGCRPPASRPGDPSELETAGRSPAPPRARDQCQRGWSGRFPGCDEWWRGLQVPQRHSRSCAEIRGTTMRRRCTVRRKLGWSSFEGDSSRACKDPCVRSGVCMQSPANLALPSRPQRVPAVRE